MFGIRVVIADSDPKVVKEVKTMLTRVGYIVVGEANDGMTALKLIRNTLPDMVILDAGLSGMSGLDVVSNIDGGKLAAVVMTAGYQQKDLLDKLKHHWVFGFMIKPFSESNLYSTLTLALNNYKRTIELEKEVDKLKSTIETRKVVDRAKGILMTTMGLSEDQAFRKIQKQSMDKGKPMRAVAEAILLAHELNN
ncbi:MAG: ANTAR domain-containing protein [Clostridia bacterium]|nr:ANTAR domain-containing protein [Clostridia bacterium]